MTGAPPFSMQARDQGVEQLKLNDRALLVGWERVEQTGWRLLTVVDEETPSL